MKKRRPIIPIIYTFLTTKSYKVHFIKFMVGSLYSKSIVADGWKIKFYTKGCPVAADVICTIVQSTVY